MLAKQPVQTAFKPYLVDSELSIKRLLNFLVKSPPPMLYILGKENNWNLIHFARSCIYIAHLMQRLFHQVVELAEQMNLMTNLVDNILNILMFAVSYRCDVDKVLKKCFTSTYVFMDFHSFNLNMLYFYFDLTK